MKRARFAIEAKCSRVVSESASIWTSYLRRIATPSSNASIESRPKPVAEQRRFAVDLVDADVLEIEDINQQLFELLLQRIHRANLL